MLAAIASLLIATALEVSSATGPPAGWRYPNTKELDDSARNESPSKLARVVADFDGDGKDDTALLLKGRKQSAESLWVRLSERHAESEWIKLADIQWGTRYPDVGLAMGIEIVQPGVIAYACFDGAKDCNFGPDSGRPKLKLASPSLMYFKLQSAASIFFWSNKHQKFLRVWISD